jgi:hypothetical protein
MALAVVAGEAADMDQPGKLPEEAATGSPAAHVGEWQPCVAEQDIATVVEGDNSLDRALGERDRTAEGDTDSEAARRDKRASDWDRRRVEDIDPDDSDLYLGEKGIDPGDWGLPRDGGTLGCL